jgi:hypothetical protein
MKDPLAAVHLTHLPVSQSRLRVLTVCMLLVHFCFCRHASWGEWGNNSSSSSIRSSRCMALSYSSRWPETLQQEGQRMCKPLLQVSTGPTQL